MPTTINLYEDNLSRNKLVFTEEQSDLKDPDLRYVIGVYNQNDEHISSIGLEPSVYERDKQLIDNITNNKSVDDEAIAELVSEFIKNGGLSVLQMAASLPSAVTYDQKTANNNKIELQFLKQQIAYGKQIALSKSSSSETEIAECVNELLKTIQQYLTDWTSDKPRSNTRP